jgi:hypothetical protein
MQLELLIGLHCCQATSVISLRTIHVVSPTVPWWILGFTLQRYVCSRGTDRNEILVNGQASARRNVISF